MLFPRMAEARPKGFLFEFCLLQFLRPLARSFCNGPMQLSFCLPFYFLYTRSKRVIRICSSRMRAVGGQIVRYLRMSQYRQRLEIRDLERCISKVELQRHFPFISFAPALCGWFKSCDLMFARGEVDEAGGKVVCRAC